MITLTPGEGFPGREPMGPIKWVSLRAELDVSDKRKSLVPAGIRYLHLPPLAILCVSICRVKLGLLVRAYIHVIGA